MPGFLYYVPKKQKVTLDDLKELGVGYAFDESPVFGRCTGPKTPGGEDGTVCGLLRHHDGNIPRVDVNGQKWRKIPQKEVWVGHWKDKPPTPEDLERKNQIQGDMVPLGQHDWRIPIVRSHENATALPVFQDLDDEGKWVSSAMAPNHEACWHALGEFYESACNAELEFDFNKFFDWTCMVLGLNYLVGRVECAMLQLVNETFCTKVMRAASAFDKFEDWAEELSKKNNQSDETGSTTPDGNGAYTQDTAQASQTSAP